MPDAPATPSPTDTPAAVTPPEPPAVPLPPPAVSRRAWVLWGLAVLGLLFALGACDVYNYDVGLHLAKGRWIIEHKSLPRPEEFITSKRPGYVYQDRWLFQVGTWLVYAAGGWTALTLVKIGFIALTFAFLWAGSRPAGPAACALATLLAALLMYERWDIRSELSIHLVFAAMIAITARGGPPGRVAWLAPFVALVGANLHSVNIGLPTLVVLAALVALFRGERADAKKWALIAAASFAAILFNPQGWRIFVIPAEYMWRYNHGPDWYRGWITEMQGVTEDLAFPSLSLRAIWVVVPVAAILLAARGKSARIVDLALLALGALAAFSFRRNIGIAGVMLFPVVARNADAAAAAIAARLAPDAVPRLRFAAAATLLAAFAATAILWTSDLAALGERTARRAGLGLSHITLPVDACDFLQREGFQGDAFVNWDAGPYYNLRLFPKSLPCMNAEGDWNLDTLKEFNEAAERPDANLAAYLAQYNLQLALLTHQSNGTHAAIAWLAASPDWALVWRDECAVVFAKRKGVNADLVKRLVPANALVAAPKCEGPEPGGFGPWGEGARRSAADRCYRLGVLHAIFNESAQRHCYEEAIRLWPKYPEAHNNLGAYLARIGEAGAEEEFREAIQLAPRYAKARLNLSIWYGNRQDYDGAIRTLEEGLDAVADADMMIQLGNLLLKKRGDPASLRRTSVLADRVLQLRPGHPGALHLKEELKGR